ncbi:MULTISPECIES: O-antigen ligase family protein [Pseudomonas]|uniref:O-antigen ligase family protein n=1 Tax=Pseudomonas TaxID=286 RepID=UPI002F2606E8
MRLNDLALGASGLILLLSLVFPTSFTLFKTIALSIPLGCLLIGRGSVGVIDSRLLLTALLFSLVGLVWSIYGAAVNNPGALRVLTVMVLYPTLFTILGMVYQGSSAGLERLLMTAAMMIVVIDLGFVMGEVYWPGNVLSAGLLAIYADNAVVDHGGNYLKFTIPNVSTVIFLLSFVLCRVVCGRASIKDIMIFIGLLVVVLISGRRVILVTAIAGPLVAFLLSLGAISRGRLAMLKVAFFVSVGLALAMVFYSLWPEYVNQRVSSILDFESDASNSERALQLRALVDGILKYPFWGNGAGAVADYVRSEEMPWAYELFYVSLIFQYGIFGFAIYGLGVVALIIFLAQQVRCKGRDSFEFCFLSGLVSFLLATATNPYLAKFDYMWVLFIPVALMNYHLVKIAQKVPTP